MFLRSSTVCYVGVWCVFDCRQKDVLLCSWCIELPEDQKTSISLKAGSCSEQPRLPGVGRALLPRDLSAPWCAGNGVKWLQLERQNLGCVKGISWGCGVKHRDARAACPLLLPNSALLNSPGWTGCLNESPNCFTGVLPLLQERCRENPSTCMWHPSSCSPLALHPNTPHGKCFPFSGSSSLLSFLLLCLTTALSFSVEKPCLIYH